MTRYSIRGSLSVMRTIRDACKRASDDLQAEAIDLRLRGFDALARESIAEARTYYNVWAAVCGVIGEQP